MNMETFYHFKINFLRIGVNYKNWNGVSYKYNTFYNLSIIFDIDLWNIL